jgi:beta-phosphoglucomutase-like phosphatase (HAD superfamily)
VRKIDIDPKAKGLIFDIDGTICDTMPVHYIAMRDTVAEYGIDFTTKLFQDLAGIPAIRICEMLKDMFNKDFDPVEVGNKKESEYERNMHKAGIVEPVVDLIKKYHGKIPMACGTGGGRNLAWRALEIAGVKDCFEHIVCADDVSNFKPHPETFLKAAELIGVAPVECQVFEDGKLGIEAAINGGMMATDVTEFYTISIGKEF